MNLEPLGAVDAAFLAIEDERDPMHIALLEVFEKEPLALASGKLDRERIRRYGRQVLSALPQFRCRIVYVPLFRRPVYADDPEFDLDYHLRFVELEAPGDDKQLKALLGRIFTEPLSRERPLWQMWCIDGLEGNRFATVTKTHHCLVDGVAGIAVVAAMLRTTPDATIQDPGPWTPSPLPKSRELLRMYLRKRVSEARRILAAVQRGVRAPSDIPAAAKRLFGAALSVVRQSLPPATRTILNPRHVGAERTFDWVHFPFQNIRDIKAAAGVTINDVVLAIVAGGIRRYLSHQGASADQTRFRVMIPVSLHGPGETRLKNEVSLMIGPLPIDEGDPRRRLEKVAGIMRMMKKSGQSHVLGIGEVIADHTFHSFVSVFARIMMAIRPFNMIVTNIPGPSFPLYFLGCPMLDAVPLVPLYISQAVGVAVLSYAGRIYFGLNADTKNMQDLPRFAACLLESFRELEHTFTPSQMHTAAQ